MLAHNPKIMQLRCSSCSFPTLKQYKTEVLLMLAPNPKTTQTEVLLMLVPNPKATKLRCSSYSFPTLKKE